MIDYFSHCRKGLPYKPVCGTDSHLQ